MIHILHNCQSTTTTSGTTKLNCIIKKTFEQLNWTIDIQNVGDYQCAIKDLSMRPETGLGALAMFFIQGIEKELRFAPHDKANKFDRNVIDALTAENCPSLAGKPKLIVIQGSSLDAVITTTVGGQCIGERKDGWNLIPNYADFLILSSSKPSDSLINTFCREISESGGNSLQDIITNVIHQQKLSLPFCTSTLTKMIYLQPKNQSSLNNYQMNRSKRVIIFNHYEVV